MVLRYVTVLVSSVTYRICLNSSRGYYLFQPPASAATIQGRLLYGGGSYFKGGARTSFLTPGVIITIV